MSEWEREGERKMKIKNKLGGEFWETAITARPCIGAIPITERKLLNNKREE